MSNATKLVMEYFCIVENLTNPIFLWYDFSHGLDYVWRNNKDRPRLFRCDENPDGHLRHLPSEGNITSNFSLRMGF